MSYAPNETSAQIYAEQCFVQGALLCAVGYGIQTALFGMCINYTHKELSSRPRQRGTILRGLYVTVLFTLNTLFMASVAKFTHSPSSTIATFLADLPPSKTTCSLSLSMSWGTSRVRTGWLITGGTQVWRFMVIYKGSIIPMWAVMAFPALIYLASITMGILWLIQVSVTSPWESGSLNWTVPYLSISLALNIILTVAITARLLVYRHRIRSVMGPGHGKKYVGIAAMLVESASLYTVFSLLVLVPFALNNPLSDVFLQALIQFQATAVFLIMYRVAQGKAWASTASIEAFTVENTAIRMSKLSSTRLGAPGSTGSVPERSGVVVSKEAFSIMDTIEPDIKPVFLSQDQETV
ncbi:hypothetical protein OE88DRAFT_1736610 [Heliocybe sulcata]|uniref:Uncharacterized protein n=1 Tax=Heliocybe sulcata TaxID=5364 RepID=A0A5C3MZH1_9AGAM|nr:hypothetical protein OE88DRAFT_1736610 [Heliocybe sulcata]